MGRLSVQMIEGFLIGTIVVLSVLKTAVEIVVVMWEDLKRFLARRR